MFWFCVFVVGSLLYLWRPWPLESWGRYWHLYSIVLPLLIGVVTTLWFTWGGIRDLRRLIRALRTVRRNEFDDGMVMGHANLDEAVAEAGDAATPDQKSPSSPAPENEHRSPA